MGRLARVNFTDIIHNDTFPTKQFNFFAADGTTPLDLSDCTVRIQIRYKSKNGKLVRTAISGDGITWTDQANGQFELGGFIADWQGAGEYWYDVQMTYATSGIIRTYVQGKITVIDDVTSNT